MSFVPFQKITCSWSTVLCTNSYTIIDNIMIAGSLSVVGCSAQDALITKIQLKLDRCAQNFFSHNRDSEVL